jgi:hypothetical protein
MMLKNPKLVRYLKLYIPNHPTIALLLVRKMIQSKITIFDDGVRNDSPFSSDINYFAFHQLSDCVFEFCRLGVQPWTPLLIALKYGHDHLIDQLYTQFRNVLIPVITEYSSIQTQDAYYCVLYGSASLQDQLSSVKLLHKHQVKVETHHISTLIHLYESRSGPVQDYARLVQFLIYAFVERVPEKARHYIEPLVGPFLDQDGCFMNTNIRISQLYA